jgi:hypothetical protein
LGSDPIWGDRGGPRLVHDTGSVPFRLLPARLPEPAMIPPRPWLYGSQLLRGFVSVLVAPGGTGKSIYAMTVGLSLAIGKSLVGDHVFAQTNTAVLNLEDPMEELDRRLAAIMLLHGLDAEEVSGRFFLYSGEDRPVTMAAVGDDGFTIVHPDEVAVVEQLRANQVGALIVDPFAESHTLEENSNPQMVRAAAAWRRIARAASCAVLLVHHVRKGTVTDIDSARGAKALTDSGRVGLLMAAMTAQEAEQFGLSPDDAWMHIRIGDAKRNLAPATKAKWLRLDQVQLGNGTRDYPAGDRVAAVVAWQPQNVWSLMSERDINAVLDRIGAGFPDGDLYAPTKRGRSMGRWAGDVLMQQFDLTEGQAREVVTTWLRTGLLVETTYRSKAQRKDRVGVVVVDTKRPGHGSAASAPDEGA